MWWMLLVLFYGVLKGVREIVKKMALKKNGVIEILFFYTFLAFLFVLPQAKDAGGVDPKAFIGIAAKAFFVFFLCSYPSDARYFSASIAALQPLAAATIAWR